MGLEPKVVISTLSLPHKVQIRCVVFRAKLSVKVKVHNTTKFREQRKKAAFYVSFELHTIKNFPIFPQQSKKLRVLNISCTNASCKLFDFIKKRIFSSTGNWLAHGRIEERVWRLFFSCLFSRQKIGDTCSKKLFFKTLLLPWTCGWLVGLERKIFDRKIQLSFILPIKTQVFWLRVEKEEIILTKIKETREKNVVFLLLSFKLIRKNFKPNQNILGKNAEFTCCGKKNFGKNCDPNDRVVGMNLSVFFRWIFLAKT